MYCVFLRSTLCSTASSAIFPGFKPASNFLISSFKVKYPFTHVLVSDDSGLTALDTLQSLYSLHSQLYLSQ